MTDRHRQREEIAGYEHWLADVCERSTEINAAPIKRAIRIALEEQWLAPTVELQMPEGLPTRVRRGIREVLAGKDGGTGASEPMRNIRVGTWVSRGLAAAAVVVLAAIGTWRVTQPSDVVDAGISFATAFEEFQNEDELDQELGRLRDAFSTLHQTVAQGWGEDLWEESVDEPPYPPQDGV